MPSNASICVVITVYNEEHHIVDCIKNARLLTDNVIVVDTESTDSTPQRAKDLGVPVYSFPYMRYVEPSRNFAISKAQADWVFILDADERFPKELIEEIQQTIDHTDKSYFKVFRNNIFAGKWSLKHGGWSADPIIRLINKSAFIDWPENIHSTPKIKGEEGILHAWLDHHFHPNLENMVDKTANFEEVEARLLFKAGRRADTPVFFRKFFGELSRRMFKHMGFLDGTPGIIEAIYQAFSKTITYLYVYEKKSTTV